MKQERAELTETENLEQPRNTEEKYDDGCHGVDGDGDGDHLQEH